MNSINKIYHADMCPICYDSYKTTQIDTCLLLKCGHIFHEKCVKNWIEQKLSCPMCDRKVFVANKNKTIVSNLIKESIVPGIQFAIMPIIIYPVVKAVNNLVQIRTFGPDDEWTFKHSLITGLIPLAINTTFYVIKHLNQKKVLPSEMPQKINYIPPNSI